MSLRDHAVPVRKEAILALTHSSRALDIYLWLSARLWRVHKPTLVKWTSLRWQFGTNKQKMSSFKLRFKEALSQVLAVYPEARVSIEYGGIMIENSKPPVPFKFGKRKGLLL